MPCSSAICTGHAQISTKSRGEMGGKTLGKLDEFHKGKRESTRTCRVPEISNEANDDDRERDKVQPVRVVVLIMEHH